MKQHPTLWPAMQRRHFLHTMGASAWALAHAASAMARTPDSPSQRPPQWRADPFALGVASGEPGPDSVLIWTRLYPGPALPGLSASATEQSDHFQAISGILAIQSCDVSYEVFSDERLKNRVFKGVFTTHAARGWSVHARVEGLQPNRHYWYRFHCGNASSPVGRTRTTPLPDAVAARLRLALASCQHYEQGHYAAHAQMARDDLDLVLFVGDYIYESSNPQYRIRPHSGGVPENLAEYRERHALYKSDADLRANHAAHPWLCTWDDHEVDNDYAGAASAKRHDTERFMARRAAAYQAYFEHMPVSAALPGAWGSPHQRIHRHWNWGRLVDLWTLDCRQYRSPQPCQDPLRGGGRVVLNCSERDDPTRTMLGAAQEDWLAQGLAGSRRHWRVLAQSTQISSTGIDTPVGRTIYTDGWDGYTAARTRLLQAIANTGLGNAVTLGGDVHQNVAADLRAVPNDPASPVVASEFVGTSVTSRGMSGKALAQIRASNPDIAHARSDERGYTQVVFTPQRATATFLTTPFPAQAGATLGIQATYAVDSGRAGVYEA